MESEILAPCQLDFSEGAEDENLGRLPVYLRIKPQEEEEMSIKILDETTVETNHASRANKKATYTRVFPGASSQQEVFDGTSANLIRKFLFGSNVMTFAYGVTSSGKTHTIMGTHEDPGVLPRTLAIIFGYLGPKIGKTIPIFKPSKFDNVEQIAIKEIDQLEHLKSTLTSKVKGCQNAFRQYSFSNTASDVFLASLNEKGSPFPADASCSVWISIFEIHNEVITDLLSTEPRDRRKPLTIGQDPKKGTFIKDLIQVPVCSASEAYTLLQFARQNLVTACTKLNDNSSRSHMVFNLKMVHWGGQMAEPFVNQFVVSDLAGSERQAKTGASGLLLKQASAINNSLLVLGRCVEALRKKDKGIAAPFRDSKLTRMLNPFFAQGGYVSLIICINPGIHLQDETMDTVRFSAIASEIVPDPTNVLERLREIRRRTLSYIESLQNSPLMVTAMTDVTGVESWRDAVRPAAVHNGVPYLEVQASYFNDMARDILRAERLLSASEAETESLKERLRETELLKENVKLMYQDKLKDQRDRFAEQRSQLEGMHLELRETIVDELEGEILLYKEKYSKYRDGYAKLSDYLNKKLWPEVSLFRERFGCLPEFPPKDGVDDEEVKPENTIKYWQDRLLDKEAENRSLRSDLSSRDERLVILTNELDDQKRHASEAELENESSRREISELSSQVNELNGQLATARHQLSDYGSLIDEVSDLKRSLREADEMRESIVAQHQIGFDSVVEELENLKAELREKTMELEETSRALTSAETRSAILNETLSSFQSNGSSTGDKESYQLTEKMELEAKIKKLETDLSEERKHSSQLQEDCLSLQDEVDRLVDREAELKKREIQTAFKLRDARRTRAVENDIARLREDVRRLQSALDEEREISAAKGALIVSHEAELDELRDKVTNIPVLGRQMQKLSEENKEHREKISTMSKEIRRLEAEVKHARELEVEVEFLTKKLENQQRRILREYPQTERAIRRRRSASTTRTELKPPATEKPRRRLRIGNEENSILENTFGPNLDRTVRDLSPTRTPYRTRSSLRKR